MYEDEGQDYEEADQTDHAQESLEQDESYEQESDDGEEQDESQQEDAQKSTQKEDQPWPKKAVRALQRQKREAARHRQELNELRREMAELRNASQSKSTELKAPDQDDFESYSDYLKANARYEAKLAYQEERKAEQERSQQTLQQKEEQFLIMQRAQQAQKMTKDLSAQLPDIYDVLQDNDELDSLPGEYQQMIMGTKNPSLTAYNLTKAGHLTDLAYTHPQIAAQMIFAASTKMPGKAAPTGKTPKPMRGLGGNNGGSGGLNPDESWDTMKKKMGW